MIKVLTSLDQQGFIEVQPPLDGHALEQRTRGPNPLVMASPRHVELITMRLSVNTSPPGG